MAERQGIRQPAAALARLAGELGARGRTPGSAVGELLFALLGAGPTELEAAVEDALVSLFEADPIGFADHLLGLEDTRRLVAGIRVLGRLGGPKLGRLLRELARSSDAEVRSAAARALGGSAVLHEGGATGRGGGLGA